MQTHAQFRDLYDSFPKPSKNPGRQADNTCGNQVSLDGLGSPSYRPQMRRTGRAGLTLIEALTAMAVVSVILAMSAPPVLCIMEEAHADTAGANLNAIWNAQRFYWLENRTYAADLATLESAGVLDATISSASGRYAYAIESADDSTFLAAATRTGSGVWSGEFTIDQTGAIAGTVQKTGAEYVISPGFQ